MTDPQMSTVLRYAHAIGAMVEIRVLPFSEWEEAKGVQVSREESNSG